MEKSSGCSIWQYGDLGGGGARVVCGCSNDVQGTYGVGLRKNIRKGWDNFHRLVYFKARDGSFIKFCLDPWCGKIPLKDNFLDIYGISCNKDASVAELLSLLGDNLHWKVNFAQLVQDWELGVSCLLF